MDKKLEKAFNQQINFEFHSAYLYLSMAVYFASKSLLGFSHWMKLQVKEETAHGMKIFDFLSDRDAKIVLQTIEQPSAGFSSPLEVFEETLKHEKEVTKLIDQLYDLAQKSGDNASAVFLQEFITEQVDEEKDVTLIVETLKMIKPDSAGLIMFDRELAKREK
jgi:ferritin